MLRGCVVGLLSVAGVGTYCSGMCLVGWLVVVAILRCLFGWGFDLQVAVCFGVVSWVLVLVVYFGLVVLSLWVDGCDQLCAGFGVWLFIWVCVSESGLKFGLFYGGFWVWWFEFGFDCCGFRSRLVAY